MLFARPKIAELTLRLFGRSLHPELFEVHQQQHLTRAGYEATIAVTSAGHVVCWRYEGLTLTEVAASAHQPLPAKRRLMLHSFGPEQTDTIECRGGVTYEVSFAIEQLSAEAFRNYQKELDLASLQSAAGIDGGHDGGNVLVHRFDAAGRVGVGATSYVDTEARDRSFRVRTLHTFPDDGAIVKTQSVFRLPGGHA
ncbi:DUF2617 family protein [Botrimarina hoheduenensis]|uniref:DUF2617 domain-containing protein n=1 Tax=Botrimarina hoheduenensis TaxID=2528000 RepID=A0A5C5W610_9BACT|nr:DUF2617 family protein [Botrimarina hoheduenensis]TWT46408.1 hypothetical protein Pla111_15040 [Botrimarina hoheduenensis]